MHPLSLCLTGVCRACVCVCETASLFLGAALVGRPAGAAAAEGVRALHRNQPIAPCTPLCCFLLCVCAGEDCVVWFVVCSPCGSGQECQVAALAAARIARNSALLCYQLKKSALMGTRVRMCAYVFECVLLSFWVVVVSEWFDAVLIGLFSFVCCAKATSLALIPIFASVPSLRKQTRTQTYRHTHTHAHTHTYTYAHTHEKQVNFARHSRICKRNSIRKCRFCARSRRAQLMRITHDVL